MIELRALEEEDIEMLLDLFQDERTRLEIFHSRKPITKDELVAVLVKADAGTSTRSFGILKDGRLVGCISLSDIHPIHRCAVVTNRAVFAREGRAASEAVEKILDYGFNTLNLHRIDCRVLPGNPTHKTCRRLGIKPDGVMREAIFREGAYHDVTVYAILREEWNERN